MKISVVLGLLLAGLAARAQSIPASGRTPASFIPSGYRQLPEGRATGDLNGDGRPDMVLVLGPIAEDTFRIDDNLPPRLLLVLWRTAMGYQLAARTDQAILCRSCGGMGDDPFIKITIANGVLNVQHYSSSSWYWKLDDKFQYRRQGIILIGTTHSSGRTGGSCGAGDWPPGCTYRDTNLLTGEYESVKVSEKCRVLENRKGRQPVRPLQMLADYKPAP